MTARPAAIVAALDFAARKHSAQRRKDAAASPYINHPIALLHVLSVEAGIADEAVLCAALLHDTLEDTATTVTELAEHFGAAICNLVQEVTDDRSLPKDERKRRQVEHAPRLSPGARLVKLADKICNLRDLVDNPPADWSLERKRAYFDWAGQVVDGVRGSHATLEILFDEVRSRCP